MSQLDVPFIPDIKVDGRELFQSMMRETSVVDERIFYAIKQLKGKGMVCITYPITASTLFTKTMENLQHLESTKLLH